MPHITYQGTIYHHVPTCRCGGDPVLRDRSTLTRYEYVVVCTRCGACAGRSMSVIADHLTDGPSPYNVRQQAVANWRQLMQPPTGATGAPDGLAFAQAFVALFRGSDMQPEDECHDLYTRAQAFILKATAGEQT